MVKVSEGKRSTKRELKSEQKKKNQKYTEKIYVHIVADV